MEKQVEKKVKTFDGLEHTILIIGGGPGLGLSIAKKFGKEGFNVGIIARNKVKIDIMVKELRGMGIIAEGFQADYHDKEELDKAMDAAIERFGVIDTVEMQFFASTQSSGTAKDSLESRKVQSAAGVIGLDSNDVMAWIGGNLEPAIQIVNKLLPIMQAHRQDYISGFLCPMGWSGIWPGEGGEPCNELPYHVLRKIPPAMGFHALVNYLEFLNAQMCFDNIYAVANMLAVWIKPNTPHAPDLIAEHLYNNIYLPRQKDPMLRRKVVETFPEEIKKPSDLIRW